MGLTPDQIKALLAKPEKKGGRGKGGKQIDTSVRDYNTWFKLAHKILDREDNETVGCDNSECLDPRVDRAILIAEVNGIHMCRYCFLDGYGEAAAQQLAIEG
jgi:hypothetical protein